MTVNEYQSKARTTAIYPNMDNNLIYVSLGLGGEVGEFLNKVKKIQRDCDNVLTDEYKLKLADELGDIMWYVAMICNELGISLEEVMMNNIEKLASRKDRNILKGNGDGR